MKKVITYGTFDLFHIGHLNLLKRAKALGDYLIVAISTDEFNKIKGKTSYTPYQERKAILEAIKYVDEVIPEKEWEQKQKDIIDNNVYLFVIGEDWKGKFDDLPCEVMYLSRTEGISTTDIKEKLSAPIIPDEIKYFREYSNTEKIKMISAINKLQEAIPDYEFYISFGTLLGAVRDNGLIDHDKDIDISYISKSHTAKEVEQETIELYKRLQDKGLLENYRLREENEEKGLWGYYKQETIDEIKKPKGQCQLVIDGVRLDTWTDWIDEEGYLFSSIRGNIGKANNYLPLVNIKVYGIILKIPNNAKMILKEVYGDWETPRDDKGIKPEKDYLGMWLGE